MFFPGKTKRIQPSFVKVTEFYESSLFFPRKTPQIQKIPRFREAARESAIFGFGIESMFEGRKPTFKSTLVGYRVLSRGGAGGVALSQ